MSVDAGDERDARLPHGAREAAKIGGRFVQSFGEDAGAPAEIGAGAEAFPDAGSAYGTTSRHSSLAA
jgi:hypothetical protein